jgi:hypothetical protein
MVWISDKQKLAMKMVDKLVDMFGVDRWFVQSELPGITALTMNALVEKGYLKKKDAELTGYGVPYYRRIKSLEP